jgi:DNA-binding GntR family transcriptional regulator
LAQRAYAAIRQAIRDGSLVHDEIYSEAALGDALGISRTPVREALIELSREGLVEIMRQRGFRLRALSDEEISEVFELREALEGYAVAKLAQRAEDGAVGQLRALIERQRKAIEQPAEFLALDEQFHLLIPRLVGLERTHAMIVNLRAVMWLIGTVTLSVHSRAPHVLEEHEAIVDAIAKGDGRGAQRALREHIRTTRSAFKRTAAARRAAHDAALGS